MNKSKETGVKEVQSWLWNFGGYEEDHLSRENGTAFEVGSAGYKTSMLFTLGEYNRKIWPSYAFSKMTAKSAYITSKGSLPTWLLFNSIY